MLLSSENVLSTFNLTLKNKNKGDSISAFMPNSYERTISRIPVAFIRIFKATSPSISTQKANVTWGMQAPANTLNRPAHYYYTIQ